MGVHGRRGGKRACAVWHRRAGNSVFLNWLSDTERADVDRQFLRLSDRWALSYDAAQWIVMKRDMGRSRWPWRAVAFIGGHRGTVCRVLEEMGCCPTKKAQIALTGLPYRFRDWIAARAYIDAMPHRFLDWLAIPPERRFKASDIAILGVVVGRLPLPRNEAVTGRKPPHDIEAELHRAHCERGHISRNLERTTLP